MRPQSEQPPIIGSRQRSIEPLIQSSPLKPTILHLREHHRPHQNLAPQIVASSPPRLERPPSSLALLLLGLELLQSLL
jgi:hypothetical protein